MPKNVMCKNCNNYRNNWCERVLDDPGPDIVRDCRHFWQRTNADRIRAMSDEELAEDYCKFLNAMLSKVAFEYKLNFEYDMEKGKSIMLKYLQQPAEGE